MLVQCRLAVPRSLSKATSAESKNRSWPRALGAAPSVFEDGKLSRKPSRGAARTGRAGPTRASSSQHNQPACLWRTRVRRSVESGRGEGGRRLAAGAEGGRSLTDVGRVPASTTKPAGLGADTSQAQLEAADKSRPPSLVLLGPCWATARRGERGASRSHTRDRRALGEALNNKIPRGGFPACRRGWRRRRVPALTRRCPCSW